MEPRDEVCSPLLPGLWVSGMPEPDWPLTDWGFSMVVSLSEHLPPQAARRFEWGTCGRAAGDGKLIFVHWPVDDGDLPDRACLEMTVGIVAGAVRAGLDVLVHCQEGRNRSGLVAALAVRTLQRVDGSTALAVVRAARPGTVSNRTFARFLEHLPAPTP